jgi:hypothetical protein
VDPNNLTNQLTTILLESFSIEPKGQGRVYQKLYPNYYDKLPYPIGYRVPESAKFSEEDGKTTLDHVGQFILQCGEANANNALKLRIFSLSLSGTILLLLLLILYLLGLNWNKKIINTFILMILSLDYHILLSSNKSIMSLPPIILGDLWIIEISALI